MHLNDSFKRTCPFKVTYNHHEQACAIAAEGLFRATGKVGIVNPTTGPGGLNTLTGLMGQYTDSIPAIYVSGQVKYETTIVSAPGAGLRQLGDQEVDIISIVKPLAKYAVSISNPADIGYELQKAYHLAISGRPGPVWVDVPMNVQGAQVDESTLRQFDASEVIPVCSTEHELADVEVIVRLLQQAKRPTVVVGHGIRLADVIDEAHRLLELLKVPALSTFNGFDLIDSASPFFCGRIGTVGTRGGNFTLQNSDLVLMLGTRNNIRQTSYNWENFAHRAHTISVDIDGSELGKPTYRSKTRIQADLKTFLPRLLGGLTSISRPDWAEWLNWAKIRNLKYPAARPEHFREGDTMQPYAFIAKLTALLPDNAIMAAGNGTACVVLFQAGIVKSGQRIFWNSGCASMGFDLPAAIGACVGSGKAVWCLAGDGSIQMNLQEFATAAHEKMPLKIIYLNNNGYASIRQTQANYFGEVYGCGKESGLGFPDMKVLSEAYSMEYVQTHALSAIERDFATVNDCKGPVVWEVMLDTDYNFEPKLSSEKLPDGRMISKPLEDMYPFLPRDEFNSNMIS